MPRTFARYVPTRRAIRRAKRELRTKGFVSLNGERFEPWTDDTYAKRRAMKCLPEDYQFPQYWCLETFGEQILEENRL